MMKKIQKTRAEEGCATHPTPNTHHLGNENCSQLTTLRHSLLSCKYSLNVLLLSAKYIHIGCLISAGENMMYQEGAPLNDIKDYILLHMYFLYVIKPSTLLEGQEHFDGDKVCVHLFCLTEPHSYNLL